MLARHADRLPFNYEALFGPWPICMMRAMPAASVEQPTKFHQFPTFVKLNGETANFTTSLNGLVTRSLAGSGRGKSHPGYRWSRS
jgi:hypothetical protein